MDTEEMKKVWDQADFRLSALEAETSRLAQMALKRRYTVFDNLRNRYRRFALISLLMVGVMSLYSLGKVWPGEYGVWISLAMSVFFIIASVLDYSLYRCLGRIDIETMPVSEVNAIVKSCRRRHLQYMAILIPMVAVLFGFILWQAIDDEYMLISYIVGAVVGLAIGIIQYNRFMDDYRYLYRE